MDSYEKAHEKNMHLVDMNNSSIIFKAKSEVAQSNMTKINGWKIYMQMRYKVRIYFPSIDIP